MRRSGVQSPLTPPTQVFVFSKTFFYKSFFNSHFVFMFVLYKILAFSLNVDIITFVVLINQERNSYETDSNFMGLG